MVPKGAVTAEAPELVNASPLPSVCRTKLTELATVTLTAIVAEAEVAEAVPVPQIRANTRPAENAPSFFINFVPPKTVQFGRTTFWRSIDRTR
jgi:hypothetical protein